MLLSMAWRNMWRNKRRTLIILIAIAIGVWTMILLGALNRGILVQMVDNGIANLSGHLQIHRKGFQADPAVENSLTQPGKALKEVRRLIPPGAHWTTRVRVSAVANNARHSGGVTLVGIDPSREPQVSFLGKAKIQGRHLTNDDENGIVIGQALARKFQTRLGHKLILMSQDTGKEIASRAFRIVGLFRAELESTEKEFVFITQPAAQKMLKLGQGISEISILLERDNGLPELTNSLKKNLGDSYEVLTWMEMLPILNTYVTMFNDLMWIWYVVVFVAMAFGIVNTKLMAIYERIREFGLMSALGMLPRWIIGGLMLESMLIILLGLISGNLLGLLSAWLLSFQGIDLSALAAGSEMLGMSRILYPAVVADDLYLANGVVLILGLAVSVYPAWKASRFTPVEALRHV